MNSDVAVSWGATSSSLAVSSVSDVLAPSMFDV